MDMLKCGKRVIFPEAVKRYSSPNFGIGTADTDQGKLLYSTATVVHDLLLLIGGNELLLVLASLIFTFWTHNDQNCVLYAGDNSYTSTT